MLIYRCKPNNKQHRNTKGENNMFYFGKDYVKLIIKRIANIIFKFVTVAFVLASFAYMCYFFN